MQLQWDRSQLHAEALGNLTREIETSGWKARISRKRQKWVFCTFIFCFFSCQRMNLRLMINTPAESEGVAQPKGWRILSPKENPVLILLDGHRSHNTLNVINLSRNRNIHLINFLYRIQLVNFNHWIGRLWSHLKQHIIGLFGK